LTISVVSTVCCLVNDQQWFSMNLETQMVVANMVYRMILSIDATNSRFRWYCPYCQFSMAWNYSAIYRRWHSREKLTNIFTTDCVTSYTLKTWDFTRTMENVLLYDWLIVTIIVNWMIAVQAVFVVCFFVEQTHIENS
jgi:hypothetical protein